MRLNALTFGMIVATIIVLFMWFVGFLAEKRRTESGRYWLRNLPYRLRNWRAELVIRFFPNVPGIVKGHGDLHLKVKKADGRIIDLGLVSRRVVTNNGVAFLVDALQNLTEAENLNYHASGTGTTAEAVTDAALVTEVEASRVAGTQSEPGTNQYRSTGTITYTATRAITEHMLAWLSSGAACFDRSVFAAVNVVSGDSIQFQYTLTLTAGG